VSKITFFWLRRDLRLKDNAGLYRALKEGGPVLPLFIFDQNILDDLGSRHDARVDFIFQTIQKLKLELEALGSSLLVCQGKPLDVWKSLLGQWPVGKVYANRDYEPYAVSRDQQVAELLHASQIVSHSSKDHVIFDQGEVLKPDGSPYTVFTPYSKKWKEKLISRQSKKEADFFYLRSYPTEKYFNNLLAVNSLPAPLADKLKIRIQLNDLGFFPSGQIFPPESVAQSLIRNYDKTRDYPAIDGVSRLGIHFRFGTISIREKANRALYLNGTYLNELIWRDFYSQILANFPQVVDKPFKPQYDRIKWLNSPEDFTKWCEGKTGYPIVDAGMRQLNATGYMHNRVRMITASFLTKHLLIDWRWGEAYFAQKLLDYDLASNSGGWQWAAGCGTDAAPYFRIFNPAEQAKKFDPEFKYIKFWVPEFGGASYPAPIVDHVFARTRCLEAYKTALSVAQ
jgi:deoxyribodipyrimidine photo-lyase